VECGGALPDSSFALQDNRANRKKGRERYKMWIVIGIQKSWLSARAVMGMPSHE
jgi:hypothetical protein